MTYRLREWLGGGGMGEVYRAFELDEHNTLNRVLAIKLNKEITNRDLCSRFEREVNTLIRLRSPHSVEVYGYGEHREEGILIAQFMIMELLEGLTLQQYLEQGPLPSNEAISIFSQIAQALQKAHQMGVIHRDLKPNNIMLSLLPDQSLRARLFDFGLSKDTSRASHQLSSSGVILGTLWYMSPEQARGEELDHRSDIFSLGIILYQMLTGQLPFPASNLFELYQLHPQGLPPLVSHMPNEIQDILRSCLAYRRQDRFRDLTDCLKLLEHPLPAFTLKIAPSSDSYSSAHHTLSFPPTKESTPLDRPEWTRWVSLILLLFILLSGLMAWLFYKKTRSSSPHLVLTLTSTPKKGFSLQKSPSQQHPTQPSSLPPRRETPTQPISPSQDASSEINPDQEAPSDNDIDPTETNNTAPSTRTIPQTRPPKRTRKIRVRLLPPTVCKNIQIFQGEKKIAFSNRSAVLLYPGSYNLHCRNPQRWLNRTLPFHVKRSPLKQEISLSLPSFQQRIFIRPWALLYLDGYLVPMCQSACEIPMWSGITKIQLKQCPRHTPAQRCLHDPKQQRVVWQKTLEITQAKEPALILRWQPSNKNDTPSSKPPKR
jgi:serine/threonine protein kinase